MMARASSLNLEMVLGVQMVSSWEKVSLVESFLMIDLLTSDHHHLKQILLGHIKDMTEQKVPVM